MKCDTQCGRPVSGARRMWTWREVIFIWTSAAAHTGLALRARSFLVFAFAGMLRRESRHHIHGFGPTLPNHGFLTAHDLDPAREALLGEPRHELLLLRGVVERHVALVWFKHP